MSGTHTARPGAAPGTTRSTAKCLATITAAAGRKLTMHELDSITGAVHARIVQHVNAGDNRFAAAARAGQQLAGKELLAAIVERRATARGPGGQSGACAQPAGGGWKTYASTSSPAANRRTMSSRHGANPSARHASCRPSA